MYAALPILVGVSLLAIAYLYPFIVVFRGGPFYRLIFRVWFYSLVGMLGFCFGLPLSVSAINPEVAREMLNNWVPEGPAVAAVMFMGWLPPLISGGIALFLREICLAVFPEWMARISRRSDDLYEPVGQWNDARVRNISNGAA